MIEVTRDLATCLALRHEVFVVEQGVPVELEADEYDATATHLLATHQGKPVGTARIVEVGDEGKIGRVCVIAAARGLGLGAALIEEAVRLCAARPHLTRAVLGAQTHALGFYGALGFVAEGEVYDDAGIPHRDMARALR